MAYLCPVRIVVDSSSCIPRELAHSWNIDVVPHELLIGDQSYRDGIDIEPNSFYDILAKNDVRTTTTAPRPQAFLEKFRCAMEYTPNIVCITVSKHFSSTYDSAINAAKMLRKQSNNCRVEIIDSESAAGAEGLLALKAAELANSGLEFEKVVSGIRRVIPKLELLAILNTLYYLGKSGRVPKIATFAGNLLGIKPITEMKLGKARVLRRPRTMYRAIEQLLNITRDRAMLRPARVNIMHSNAESMAHDLKGRVKNAINCKEIFISEFTPVMGNHLGPGLLGLAFYPEE